MEKAFEYTNSSFKERKKTMGITERLLKYVAIKTPCSETSDTHPTTMCQFDLARVLEEELREMGASDVILTDDCFVYAKIPATAGCESCKKLGFIAHMDTVPEFCEAEITPILHENYDGKDLPLGTSGKILTVKDFPHLKDLAGRTLITSDGNTLLGVDDKAGIAEIMELAAYLLSHDVPHGQISIAFTPDEECGEGVACFDLKRFDADVAYTLDGDDEGQVQYQNFNACDADFEIRGVNVHPGSAKDVMINAVLLAAQINAYLPEFETPRDTSDYEGFYHLLTIHGDESYAKAEYIVRDHDAASFEARKATLRHIEKIMNEKWGAHTVTLTITDSYANMESVIAEHMYLIDYAKEACRRAGVPIDVSPIRGGTDGCRLSFMGLPCPNLGTGGHGYHGPYEHVTVEGMEKSYDILIELVKLFAEMQGR